MLTPKSNEILTRFTENRITMLRDSADTILNLQTDTDAVIN